MVRVGSQGVVFRRSVGADVTRNFFFFFPPLPPSLQVGTDVIRSVGVVSWLANIVLPLVRVCSWPGYIILLPGRISSWPWHVCLRPVRTSLRPVNVRLQPVNISPDTKSFLEGLFPSGDVIFASVVFTGRKGWDGAVHFPRRHCCQSGETNSVGNTL